MLFWAGSGHVFRGFYKHVFLDIFNFLPYLPNLMLADVKLDKSVHGRKTFEDFRLV